MDYYHELVNRLWYANERIHKIELSYQNSGDQYSGSTSTRFSYPLVGIEATP